MSSGSQGGHQQGLETESGMTYGRRRVPTACDSCRRKKQKCDGKQPCGACSSMRRRCTYDTAHGTRVSVWTRVEMLEDRLRRSQKYLKSYLESSADEAPADIREVLESPDKVGAPPSTTQPSHGSRSQGDNLESMIGDDENYYRDGLEYFGRSSGHAFLHATKGFFGQDEDAPDTANSLRASQGKQIVDLFDSPLPKKDVLKLDVPLSHLLPSYASAQEMIANLHTVCASWFNFLHLPTFNEAMDRVYRDEAMDFTDEDHAFLPLLYTVLALGYLFSGDSHRSHGHNRSVWQGMRHFVAARKLIDVTRCCDLLSLQIIICMAHFLQSTARISTCHSYIAIAVSVATRLGLHRKSPESMNPVEQETRKRLFWAIQRLDSYVGLIRGLPILINLEDVDQTMPIEIEDELITSHGIYQGSIDGPNPVQSASNAHTALQIIMRKLVKYLYPVRELSARSAQEAAATQVASYAKLQIFKADLDRWQQSVEDNHKDVFARGSLLAGLALQLRMAHAFAYIVLHRPFLHYIAKAREEGGLDRRKLGLAEACITASHDAIDIAKIMSQHDLLYAASWPCVYTVFLATVSLLFYKATAPENADASRVQGGIDQGQEILTRLEPGDLGPPKFVKILEMLRRCFVRHDTPANGSQGRQEEGEISWNPTEAASLQPDMTNTSIAPSAFSDGSASSNMFSWPLPGFSTPTVEHPQLQQPSAFDSFRQGHNSVPVDALDSSNDADNLQMDLDCLSIPAMGSTYGDDSTQYGPALYNLSHEALSPLSREIMGAQYFSALMNM